jgi:hypothetical protein
MRTSAEFYILIQNVCHLTNKVECSLFVEEATCYGTSHQAHCAVRLGESPDPSASQSTKVKYFSLGL